MNEGSTDVHPSTPEPNPLTPQHNAPPAPDDEEPAAPAAKGRDDDRMGETSEDILDSISELAGSRKDKEEASEEPLIEDAGSAHTSGWSVTNSVTVDRSLTPSEPWR